MTPLIRFVTLAVLPISVLISFTQLLGAEHGPGDGFTAGIISALGFTLQYISFGHKEARRMFSRFRFQVILTAGLATAVVASVIPMFLGQAVLELMLFDITLPVIGDVHLSRSMLFDIGVYLVVFGGAMTAVDTLGKAIE